MNLCYDEVFVRVRDSIHIWNILFTVNKFVVFIKKCAFFVVSLVGLKQYNDLYIYRLRIVCKRFEFCVGLFFALNPSSGYYRSLSIVSNAWNVKSVVPFEFQIVYLNCALIIFVLWNTFSLSLVEKRNCERFELKLRLHTKKLS